MRGSGQEGAGDGKKGQERETGEGERAARLQSATGRTRADQVAEYRELRRNGFSRLAAYAQAMGESFWGPIRAARRTTRKDFKSGQGLAPMPVYVATMKGGRQVRVTFWSRAGKPVDFASGFNCAMTIGRGIPVSGHVEHLGRTMSDPHFAQVKEVSRKETPATRLKALRDAVRAGDFERAKQLAAA